MANRIIGAERLFSLGDYKNIRLIESVEFDDEGFTDDELDSLRLANLYNLYMGFALHQLVLKGVKELGFDEASVARMVVEERQRLAENVDSLVAGTEELE